MASLCERGGCYCEVVYLFHICVFGWNVHQVPSTQMVVMFLADCYKSREP